MIENSIGKFQKCDLHIHSSSCYSRKYTKHALIEKLKSLDLDVISITDHNIIDVALYNDLKSELAGKTYIIGGIEVNVQLSDKLIKDNSLTTKSEYFHAILWFDNSLIPKVWNEIKKYILTNFNESLDSEKMSINEISNKMKDKIFDYEKLQSQLSGFDYYFIFHENKGDRNLSDYLDNKSKENEKFKRRLFYFNNSLALEGDKERNRKISDYFAKQLNTIVSSFVFSDAKTIDEIGEKYSWINFNGKFDNLILAFSDPDSRIFTSDVSVNNPQKNRFSYLESIRFFLKRSNGDEQVEIFCSPGLNGVIGARGSGKSMLGNILAKNDLDKYSKLINNQSIEYKLIGKEYSKSSPENKYLKQSALLKIFDESKYEDLDFIKDFYRKIISDKNSETKKSVDLIVVEFEKQKTLLTNFIIDYPGSERHWDFLYPPKVSENLLILPNRGDFPNNVIEFNKTNEQVTNLGANLRLVKESFEKIKFSDFYSESHMLSLKIDDFKTRNIKLIDQINQNISEFNEYIESMKYDELFINRNELIDEFISLTVSHNNNANLQSSKYSEDKQSLVKYLNNILALRVKLNISIEKVKVLFSTMINESYSENISLNGSDKIDILTSIEGNNLDSIYKDFLKIEDTSEMDSFYISILLQANEFERFRKNFNGSKLKGVSASSDLIKKYFNSLSNEIKQLGDLKLKIRFNGKDLNELSPGKRSEILLEIFLYNDTAKYSEYTYVILDQPEDNLDTHTITRKLVSRLKDLKLQKQFFVISHSAPVIINADSDLVIVSKENVNEISYDTGTINNNELKTDIVEILDGGEINLKMRLNKYDFNQKEKL